MLCQAQATALAAISAGNCTCDGVTPLTPRLCGADSCTKNAQRQDLTCTVAAKLILSSVKATWTIGVSQRSRDDGVLLLLLLVQGLGTPATRFSLFVAVHERWQRKGTCQPQSKGSRRRRRFHADRVWFPHYPIW